MATEIDAGSTPVRSIGIGPELPEFGSWNWIGRDWREMLGETYHISTFSDLNACPRDVDAVIFVKFKPDASRLQALSNAGISIIFAPVDVYGSVAEIDADRDSLSVVDAVLVHSRRLLRYFAGYCPVKYIDHAIKYATGEIVTGNSHGPYLWVGRRCNLAPLVAWKNQTSLDRELWLLTNDVDEGVAMRDRSKSVGLKRSESIRIQQWTPELQIAWTAIASCAIDVKVNDFRARHKPPAKALDFAASGLPLASNRGSSVDLHFRQLGQRIVPLDEIATCRSSECVAQARDFALTLRERIGFQAVSEVLHRHVEKTLEG